MMNDNARSPVIVGATALVTGLCVGVGAGILFAPHSGARTRRHLRSFAEDRVEDTSEEDKAASRRRPRRREPCRDRRQFNRAPKECRFKPGQSGNPELRWWFT